MNTRGLRAIVAVLLTGIGLMASACTVYEGGPRYHQRGWGFHDDGPRDHYRGGWR